jgi:DNA-binding transcriptional ArsR family regulator
MSRDEAHDAIFKALGDSRRRAMLDLLKDGPRTTGALVERFPELDRTTVMQHLGVLEKAGLVIAKKKGRERWNYFSPLPIQEIHDRWISRYAVSSVRLLAKLKADLED